MQDEDDLSYFVETCFNCKKKFVIELTRDQLGLISNEVLTFNHGCENCGAEYSLELKVQENKPSIMKRLI